MCTPLCLELQLNSHVSTHFFHHLPQALCLQHTKRLHEETCFVCMHGHEADQCRWRHGLQRDIRTCVFFLERIFKCDFGASTHRHHTTTVILKKTSKQDVSQQVVQMWGVSVLKLINGLQNWDDIYSLDVRLSSSCWGIKLVWDQLVMCSVMQTLITADELYGDIWCYISSLLLIIINSVCRDNSDVMSGQPAQTDALY